MGVDCAVRGGLGGGVLLPLVRGGRCGSNGALLGGGVVEVLRGPRWF